MKKKIGIITFHASHNCGSMLQAYALQTILEKKYDCDVELIDYINKGSRNLYGMLDFRLKKSAIRSNLTTLLHYPAIKKYHEDYKLFSEKYLKKTSQTFYDKKSLASLDGKYDIVIAGGDQVWNTLCADADTAYFLDFIKKSKKVAYSPSLGGNNINNVADPKAYAALIKDFDCLSVREPNGQKWIKELTGIEVPIIADPTLLLTKEEWLTQFDLQTIDEPFIFNYAFFHNRPDANKVIQEISDATKLPVYVMDTKSWYSCRLDKYGIKKFSMTGPLAFLALMNKAEMVLTQSFHGTLFSALFHKQFWSYRAPSINKIDDDRATAILKQLGLSDRYKVIDDLPKINYMEQIDYSLTDELVAKLRDKSFDYIKSFLNKKLF